MNKNELIEALAPRLGGRAAAALAVESFVDVVLRQVAAGRSVGITGFGTFERVDRAARTGRNPHTGAAVPIAAVSRPRFRPGTYFTSVVADPGQLPASGLAGARVGSSEAAGPTGEGQGWPQDGVPAGDGGNGAPASIRRTAPPVEESRPAEEAPARTSRPRTSGTPPTVRADRRPSEEESAREPRREPALGGRVMMSGEDITRSMIKAKKAELARAKNDALAPNRSTKGKKSKKGKKKSQQESKP